MLARWHSRFQMGCSISLFRPIVSLKASVARLFQVTASLSIHQSIVRVCTSTKLVFKCQNYLWEFIYYRIRTPSQACLEMLISNYPSLHQYASFGGWSLLFNLQLFHVFTYFDICAYVCACTPKGMHLVMTGTLMMDCSRALTFTPSITTPQLQFVLPHLVWKITAIKS